MPRIKPSHIFISVFLLFVFVLSFTALYRIQALLSPVSSDSDIIVKEINIPIGSSTAKIAAILQEEGIIQNAFLFRLFSRYRGYDARLKAGQYLLSSDMSTEEILEELQKGIVQREGIRFTVPEGFTIEQIGARLEEQGLIDKTSFLEICRTYGEVSADHPLRMVGDIPSQVHYRLEGYLFPDTYEVFPGVTTEEIVELMLSRFFEVFNEDYMLRAEELGLSVHQVVTVASLVEKEAVLPEERPLVSAVFHNRLQSATQPLLQSCATIQYILGEPKPILTNEDLKIDSPFNTYLYPALPPGPIASPGRSALEAALYPAEVDFLFFVAKEDGTGGHYFSKTLQEHNNYKNLVQRQRR